MISSVPQGTVLGPILFLILIGGINDNTCSHVSFFADDTRVLLAITNEDDIQTLQNDLKIIYKWQQVNNMQFNENKFELLRYGKNQDIKDSASYFGPNSRKIEQIQLWNEMLAKSAVQLMKHRNSYVEQVNQHLNDIFKDISGRPETLKLIYKPSLNSADYEEKNCLQQLEKSLSRDLQYGFAVLGPHRDEYHLMMDGKKDRDFFSQGEFRITNLSLKMTINRLFYEGYQFYPVLIFDDLFSELDDEVINNVLQYFLTLKNQIFITSTSEPSGSLTVKKFNIVKGELV